MTIEGAAAAAVDDPPPIASGPAGAGPLMTAVIAAATDQVWPRPVELPDERDPAHSVWRFSGRWWNKPTPIRRERPWTGG